MFRASLHLRPVIADDWPRIEQELNDPARNGEAERGTATCVRDKEDRPVISDSRSFGDLAIPENRQKAFAWLAERVNTFVNVLRPRVRSAVADYQVREAD